MSLECRVLCFSTTFHSRRHRGGTSDARQRLMHRVKAAILKTNNDMNKHYLVRKEYDKDRRHAGGMEIEQSGWEK